MPVSKGLSTYAGLVGAVGQYMAVIALFLEADDPALALGPLATGTATLITVIAGRMWQAKPAASDRSSWGATTATSSGTTGNVTWTTGRPGVEMTNPQPKARDPYADSIPAGSVPAEDGQ